MAEPSMIALSRLMTDLVNTTVTFKPAKASTLLRTGQIFGTYLVTPDDGTLVVQSDLLLLGSLAGAFTGMPNAALGEHMTPLSEVLRDAVHELLNITSTALVTSGRAVFQAMTAEFGEVVGPAANVLRAPLHATYFDVTVDRYRGGRFTVFSGPLPL